MVTRQLVRDDSPMTQPSTEPNGQAQPTPASTPDSPSPSGGARVFPEIDGFRLIQELGRSPAGIVYKGRRLVEQDVVAVKILREGTSYNPTYWDLLKKNAEASFLLEHPGIVRSLGSIEANGRRLLVMEYARGEPLSRALQRNVRFRPPRALYVVQQCAIALAYAAQRKRTHGRLHPGDVILSDEDEIRLLGVGLGEHPEHAAWSVKDGHLFEPLIYSPPEALPSKTFPDTMEGRCAVDLFSLGALLYHMLTGSAPYRGTDEGSIQQERESYPSPVRWPRGTEKTLPPRSMAIVEHLLAVQPQERGSYDKLLVALEEALSEAEGKPMPRPQPSVAPIPVLAPPEVPVVAGTTGLTGTPGSPASEPGLGSGRARRRTSGAVSLLSKKRLRTSSRLLNEQRMDRISMPLLVGAVIFVFGFTAGMAVKTFFFAPGMGTREAAGPSKTTNPTPQNSRVQNSGQDSSPKHTGQRSEQPVAPPMSGAEGLAAKRLELVQEMLSTGEATYSSATLRVLRDVEAKAGPGTRTELAARLMIAKVEERIAEGPTANRAAGNSREPTDAEEKVFQDLVARAKELADEKRFGAASKHMSELPEPLRMAPFTERAAEHVKNFEQQAKASFAETSLLAEKALGEGDHAKARGLYQAVQARYGIQKWSDAAGVRLKAIQAEEEQSRKKKEKVLAEQTRVTDLATLAKGLETVIPLAASFKYDEAKTALDKIAATLKDAENRTLAAQYAKLIHDEKWMFKRCQTRLKEAIDRDGKSPIVVNNAKNKDAPGLEIVAFDHEALTFTASRGRASGRKVRKWDTIGPSQPIVMLRLLMDKANASEHMALSLIAFHRAVRMQLAARNPDQKEATPDEWRKRAGDFKRMYIDGLNAGIQADTSARDRVEAQRTVMNKIYDLAANPPKAPAVVEEPENN